jgi:hypothetical protein
LGGVEDIIRDIDGDYVIVRESNGITIEFVVSGEMGEVITAHPSAAQEEIGVVGNPTDEDG